MIAGKKYITDITAKDVAELAAITQIRVGPGLRLRKDSGGWVLDLDPEGMKVIMSQIGVAWGDFPASE